MKLIETDYETKLILHSELRSAKGVREFIKGFDKAVKKINISAGPEKCIRLKIEIDKHYRAKPLHWDLNEIVDYVQAVLKRRGIIESTSTLVIPICLILVHDISDEDDETVKVSYARIID